MKSAADKDRYITLRAEGVSISAAAKQLKIGKATASAWEKELKGTISATQQARLDELAEKYGMAREARVKRLGETLSRIDEALYAVDFSTILPEKLLDLKLKYTQALKEEELPKTEAPVIAGDGSPYDVFAVLCSIMVRSRSGEITEAQARSEVNICLASLKAHEAIDTSKKIDELERLVNGQGR